MIKRNVDAKTLTMTPEQIERAEKEAGRKLKQHEIIRGRLDRQPHVDTPEERIAKSLAQTKSTDIFALEQKALDEVIAEREKKVADERFKKLSKAQQDLESAKQAKAKMLERQIKQKKFLADKARPDDTLIKIAINRLELLEEKVAFSSQWTYEEMLMLHDVRIKLFDSDVPAAAAIAEVDKAYTIHEHKRRAAGAELRQKMEHLRASYEEAKAVADELDPEGSKPVARTPAEIGALWDKHKAAERDGHMVDAAVTLQQWSDAVDSFGGLDALRAVEAGGSDAG
jgi:hypothetical protein